jgi:rhodanese-related sulfurtransferase
MKQVLFALVLWSAVACQTATKPQGHAEPKTGSSTETKPAEEAKPQTQGQANTGAKIFTDDVAAFEAGMNNSPRFILIDVRTPEEYQQGALANAGNIDFYASDFKDKLAELPKGFPVYVYCRSGGRSANAAKVLVEMGYTEVHNLKGGYLAWKQAGKQ